MRTSTSIALAGALVLVLAPSAHAAAQSDELSEAAIEGIAIVVLVAATPLILAVADVVSFALGEPFGDPFDAIEAVAAFIELLGGAIWCGVGTYLWASGEPGGSIWFGTAFIPLSIGSLNMSHVAWGAHMRATTTYARALPWVAPQVGGLSVGVAGVF